MLSQGDGFQGGKKRLIRSNVTEGHDKREKYKKQRDISLGIGQPDTSVIAAQAGYHNNGQLGKGNTWVGRRVSCSGLSGEKRKSSLKLGFCTKAQPDNFRIWSQTRNEDNLQNLSQIVCATTCL